jgi:hypothetical protein
VGVPARGHRGHPALRALRKVMSTAPVLSDSLTSEEAALLRDCLTSTEHRLPTAAAVTERLLRL